MTDRAYKARIEDAILTILHHELFNRNTGLSVAHYVDVTRTIYKLEDGSIAVSTFGSHGDHRSEELFSDDRAAVQRFIELVAEAEK